MRYLFPNLILTADSFLSITGISLIVGGVSLFVGYRFLKFVESIYVDFFDSKPLFRHWPVPLKTLSKAQKIILKNEFSFYRRLTNKEQQFFEHRVVRFLSKHDFVDKGGCNITDQKQVLVAATAVMLTFGYRDYSVNSVERFLIYPEVFYSNINKAYHKGEFNLGYKAIVLSWKDFLHGYDIDNDNYNVGIHEYVHAMHFDFLRTQRMNVSAAIFLNALESLNTFLEKNPAYKSEFVNSKYLRDYAYTNKFEFTAVLIESFIETPNELRSTFPEIYGYVKKMLNFNFAGY